MSSRMSAALRVQGSVCGCGESLAHPCAYMPYHCGSNSDTAEKRWPLGIMTTFKTCRMRKPDKVRYQL